MDKNWKNYALIGSRDTPVDICGMMSQIAYYMARDEWVLRSGAAEGADQAAQNGCEQYAIDANKPWNQLQEIFLPWNGFNKYYEDHEKGYYLLNHVNAENIARDYHPVYAKLSTRARQLIIRNGYQILGKNLDFPVNLVICWTPDGSYGYKTTKDTGGTGHALRIAYDYDISVYNLKNQWDYDTLKGWVEYKEGLNQNTASVAQ